MMFTGHNILPGFPEELSKMVAFLTEKVAVGEFEFSDSLNYWAEKEDIILPLKLSYFGENYYYAVSLAHLAQKNNGHIAFPDGINIWSWAWSVTILASVAEWSPEIFKNVINSFWGREEDINGLMNRAAQSYAKNNYNRGMALLSEIPPFRLYILSGLLENNFENYCHDFPPTDNQEEFANVFVTANTLRQEDVIKAFDMASDFSGFSSALAMAFYLTAHQDLDEFRKEQCEHQINALLNAGDTLKYVDPLSNWLFKQDNLTPFSEECILSLVKGLGIDNSGRLKTIDNAVAFKDVESAFFIQLLTCVAENLKPTDIMIMDHCLHSLSKKSDVFMNFVLSFILHPKGMYRICGRRIWDQYHLEGSAFDPMILDETLQCIFIISMLQDFGNPQTRLPKVLPLLKSESVTVRGTLMKYIRPYLDDYMGHVINALDILQIDCVEEKTIRKYFERRSEALKTRRKMKELSPSYTHGNELREAMRIEKQHRQSQIKEAEAEHKPAWMDLMASVVLARGGGWREKDGTTQHLTPINFSMPARQLVQALSPKEQDEWLDQLLRDWDDKTGNH